MSQKLNIKLHVSYGKSFRLSCEELSLSHGLYVIFGANGSGKSTFLKALGQFIQSDEYQCSFGELDLSTISNYDRSQLFSYSGARLESNIRIKDLLEVYKTQTKDENFELPAAWLDKSLAELSDGERQKVQHYLAVQNEKKLVLFDEPTAHLDPVQKAKFWEQAQEHAHSFGKTMLAASHDYLELKDAQVQFLIIRNGKLEGPFSSNELPKREAIY